MVFTNPDYAMYTGYGGKLKEAQFNALISDAVYTASQLTFTRSENPPTLMHERVQRCICELVDVKHSYATARQHLPRGIGSISNDGYSLTASTASSTQASEQADYTAVCRKYLLLPVNLMFGGIGRGGHVRL